MGQGKYYGAQETLSDPGDEQLAVVKGEPFPACKYLFVGTGGDLIVKGAGGENFEVWKNIADGSHVAFRAVEISDEAGCTVDDILAIY